MNRLRKMRSTLRSVLIWPKRVTTVVYPPGKSSELLLQYLDPNETQVINPWGRELNLPTLLHMVLTGDRSRFGYLISYLKLARPKFLVTTSDNNLDFYRIKSLLPNVTTISIQNGIRGNYSSKPNHGFIESIQNNKDLSSSYAITFGSALSQILEKNIATKTYVAGSLRNNSFGSGGVKEESDLIIYVSQLPSHKIDPHSIVAYYQDAEISYLDFYQAERNVCDQLARYCLANDLRFEIAGKQNSGFTHEKAFFDPYKISSRNSPLGSYEQLSRANLIVTLDSTIGYEFLARGKRVAFIGGRFALHKNKTVRGIPDVRFGFPLELNPTGSFWIDNLNDVEVVQLLDRVRLMPQDEWQSQLLPFENRLMKFDPNNQELVAFFSNLGIPILPVQPRVA